MLNDAENGAKNLASKVRDLLNNHWIYICMGKTTCSRLKRFSFYVQETSYR